MASFKGFVLCMVAAAAAAPPPLAPVGQAASHVPEAAGKMADAKSNDEAKAREAWCHREYVSEKDCDKWVADQLARREARRADEEKRRQDRVDDEARRQEERSEDQTHGREEQHENLRQQDSHSDETQTAISSSSSDSGSNAGPTMLLAALADTQTSNVTHADSDAEAAARATWCHEEYVSEKDCDEWVADQLARRAARKADEKKRQQDRHEDEVHRQEERHEDEARRKHERRTDSTATKPVLAGPTMMLAVTQDATNSSVHLTEEEQHQLDVILAKLHKRAAHEEKYAAEDGQDEVDFFKKEYARKEEQAIAKFVRKVAADGKKVDASHVADRPVANLTKGSDAKTDPNGKPFAAGQMLTMMVAAPDSQASDAQLTEEQQQQLKSILAKLRKKAEHEEKYAAEDGETAVDFFKKEYARKEDHATAEFMRKVAAAAKKVDGAEAHSDANSAEKDAAGDVAEQRNATPAKEADVILPGAGANLVAVADAAAPSPAPAGQAVSQGSEGGRDVVNAERSDEATAHEAWCRREYVSKKDCEKWVADQLARRAARKADEEKRRQDRREDEARRQEERDADEARRRQERHEETARAGAPRDHAAHRTNNASKGKVAAEKAAGSEAKPDMKKSIEKDVTGDANGKPSAKPAKEAGVVLRGAAANLAAVSTSMGSLSLLSLAAMATSAAALAYFAKSYRTRRGVGQEPLLG